MWFYIGNESTSLPRRTPGPPVKRASWNSRGGNVAQVKFLLVEIEKLKKDHQISGAFVIAHWSLWRIQSVQRRVHLGFQYVEETDPSRFTRSKISELELKDRVARLLKNVVGQVSITGSFGAGRRPREVLLRVVDCS